MNKCSAKCSTEAGGQQESMPVMGRLEQIVQLADNIVPSTSLALQIHEELKKSGILSKRKNTMVYLMSAKGHAGLSPTLNVEVINDKKSVKGCPGSNPTITVGTVNKKVVDGDSNHGCNLQNCFGTVDKNCSEQTSRPHVSGDSNVSSHCTVQAESQSTLHTNSESIPPADPVVTKEGSAVAQIGTLTLPIVAPQGITLSKSAEYIPVLCQIGGGKKNTGSDTTKHLPVYLLKYPPGDEKNLKKENISSSFITLPSADQPLVNNKHGKLKPVQSISQICSGKDAGKSVGHEANQVTSELSTKAVASSGSWKIINGSLVKGESLNGMPLSFETSRALVRLPLGTGQAPSLVTSDGKVLEIQGKQTCSGQQVTPTMMSRLKQLVEKTTSSTEDEHVQDNAKATSSVPHNDCDKNVTESTQSSNFLLCTEDLDHLQDKIAYAYATEGLKSAPVLLICDPNDPLMHVGGNYVVKPCDSERSQNQSHGKRIGHVHLDTCCLSGSLLTMKDNTKLTMDCSSTEQCTKNTKDNQQTIIDNCDGEMEESEMIIQPERQVEHSSPLSCKSEDLSTDSICTEFENKLDENCSDQALKKVHSDSDFQEDDWNLPDDICTDDVIMDGTSIGRDPKVDVLDGIVFVDGVEIEVPTPCESISGFCCYICGFAAIDKEVVIRHWFSTHAPEKPYICGVCRAAAFSSNCLLTKHIKHFHSSFADCMPMILKPSQVFKNSLVMVMGKDENITSKRLDALWNRDEAKNNKTVDGMAVVDDSLAIYCNSCSFSTQSVIDMRIHLKRLHPKPYCFNCVDCHKLFLCRFDLARHRRIVHGSQDENSSEYNGMLFQHKVSVKLNGAYMNWNKLCRSRYNASNVPQLECQLCQQNGLETVLDTAKSMWLHLEVMHKWPSHLYCSTCASKIHILDAERREKKTYCHRCSQLISLKPVIEEESYVDMPVYICKVCNYKTMERSSIFRHVKYSYAQFKPFSCPYCKYSSSEKAKVKHHVMNSHTDERRMVKVNFEAIHRMREKIDALMEKITMKVKYRDLELLLGEDESMYSCEWNQKYQAQSNGRTALKVQPIGSSSAIHIKKKGINQLYQCEDCPFIGQSLMTFSRHRRHVHNDLNAPVYVSTTRQLKFLKSSHSAGQYFQCSICHYCCLDRSSMTRHIKYMHMHERPHGCPYCGYKNVEKTKVRIHVISAHSGSPVYVKSDMKLLKAMSQRVKGNYKRILTNQGEVPKRKPGRPSSGYHSKVVIEQEDKSKLECTVNSHSQSESYSEGSEHQTSKTDNDNQCDLPAVMKSEPEFDTEVKFEGPDCSINELVQTEMSSECFDASKPGLELNHENGVKCISDLTEKLEFNNNVVSNERPDCVPEDPDEDGQVVDVAWLVETIDTDSDDERQSENSEELDVGETDVISDAATVSPVAPEKRKRVPADENEEKQKAMKIMWDDRKLRMKPVVVLRDVIQQILCSEFR